jgi:glycosyltransferase involved in cell wall biosynthesis
MRRRFVPRYTISGCAGSFGTASAISPHVLPRDVAPRVSVVLSTYNRGPLLHDALRSVLAQDPAAAPDFELIVVDNNSTDDTRTVVEAFAAADNRVHYVFEHEQGLSFARNTGIRCARASLIAFTDDDVRIEANWLAAIVGAFEEQPEAAVVGGRVLPIWPATPPAWLTRDHWAPLALVDHGDAAVSVTLDNPICLVGACTAYRRSVFDEVGLFASDLQRVKNGIGSLEDHEFLLRVLRSGRTGLYDPRIVVHAEVQCDRIERHYHRRWHAGHGHFHALLRSEEMERTTVGTLFGVPAHLYRQAAGDVGAWLLARARHDEARAFIHELRLQFFRGFFRTRRREFFRVPAVHRRAEMWYPRKRPGGRQPSMTASAPRRV